jgi:hypothetical protein
VSAGLVRQSHHGYKNKFLGSVMAKDLENAKEKTIVFFKLSRAGEARANHSPR